MKVSSVSLINNFKNIGLKSQTKKSQTNAIQNSNLSMPTSAHYISFMGGNSVNLAETARLFKPEEYPPEIKDAVFDVLIEGNSDDKTLYDVHFNKYKGILDCFTLDELKEKYPEFEGTISAYEVLAKEDSFVGKFQADELDLFPFDEDLTLQLIKLYWGQGFSLNDLSKYIEQNSQDKKGINLYYAMTQKLNIPIMNSHYAGVLKLSNKEYNEKFTSEMSMKLLEAHEAREQRADGEPVIIPRKPLSEEHKRKISESLKRYYEQNPQKLYEMSVRQKRFYEENPDKKEELSEVMLVAWNNTREGKNVRKHLNKYIKKHTNDITDSQLALREEMTTAQQKAFGDFWKRNTWAKEQMSIAIKKAYAELEQIRSDKSSWTSVENETIVFNSIPTQMKKDIIQWAKQQGYDTEHIVIGLDMLYDREVHKASKKEISYFNRGEKIYKEYMKAFPQKQDQVATYLHFALMKIGEDLELKPKRLLRALNNDAGKAQALLYMFNAAQDPKNPIFIERNGKKTVRNGVDTSTIKAIYQSLMQQAFSMNCLGFAEYGNEVLDECYEKYNTRVL